MANFTRAELVTAIDFERRETNARFVSPAQIVTLLDRCVKDILRKPNIKTVRKKQTIAVSGTGIYTADLNSDFKEGISLTSGAGSNPIQFRYYSVDDFDNIISGYAYTFRERGKIEIKFPNADSLPSTNLVLNYWSKNIVLDENGTTEKRVWGTDNDTSLLEEGFDEFYIERSAARILRKEGKAEWKDRWNISEAILNDFVTQGPLKVDRPRRAFGHYQLG